MNCLLCGLRRVSTDLLSPGLCSGLAMTDQWLTVKEVEEETEGSSFDVNTGVLITPSDSHFESFKSESRGGTDDNPVE